jgi:hypothetical protein
MVSFNNSLVKLRADSALSHEILTDLPKHFFLESNFKLMVQAFEKPFDNLAAMIFWSGISIES